MLLENVYIIPYFAFLGFHIGLMNIYIKCSLACVCMAHQLANDFYSKM
jgi:hypothetical protein